MPSMTVYTSRYEGNDFPESEHYPEYLAKRLAEAHQGVTFSVHFDVSDRVFGYGFGDELPDVAGDVRAIMQDIWNDFCEDGYKAYSGAIPDAEIFDDDTTRIVVHAQAAMQPSEYKNGG